MSQLQFRWCWRLPISLAFGCEPARAVVPRASSPVMSSIIAANRAGGCSASTGPTRAASTFFTPPVINARASGRLQQDDERRRRTLRRAKGSGERARRRRRPKASTWSSMAATARSSTRPSLRSPRACGERSSASPPTSPNRMGARRCLLPARSPTSSCSTTGARSRVRWPRSRMKTSRLRSTFTTAGLLIALVRAVLPGMRARKWGRIVAIHLGHGETSPNEHMVTSVGARAGLTGVLKSLSFAAAADNVTINQSRPSGSRPNARSTTCNRSVERDGVTFQQAWDAEAARHRREASRRPE